MFLNGNFVALPAFAEKYGVYVEGSGYTIPTRWQSALFQSGQCGAFVGVFLAGPITNRLGYRWTTILALMLMNATIFISFFVSVHSSVPIQLSMSADHAIRPTLSPCLSSARHSKAFLGGCSSPTRPPMRVRLFPSPSAGPVRRHFR